jgi:hypothetical protein
MLIEFQRSIAKVLQAPESIVLDQFDRTEEHHFTLYAGRGFPFQAEGRSGGLGESVVLCSSKAHPS